jgi:hypothetical protein
MLRVVYEAATDLTPGRLVEIAESRGRVDIKLRRDSDIDDVLHDLNSELQKFVARCNWFQIWRGQILGSTDSPLAVQYVTDPEVDWRTCVQVREFGGTVRLHVCPDASPEHLVRALNPSIERFLAGGQWFQLWHGEIITMDSPGSSAA